MPKKVLDKRTIKKIEDTVLEMLEEEEMRKKVERDLPKFYQKLCEICTVEDGKRVCKTVPCNVSYKCPSCGTEIYGSEIPKVCPNCGSEICEECLEEEDES